MLTIITQAAIAVLHDIASGNNERSANFLLAREELEKLLNGLEAQGLIRREQGTDENLLSRYRLCRPLHQCSLLEVLEATGEPIHCNQPTPESYYLRYGEAAKKIGVFNHMARTSLADIRLTDW